MKLTSRERFGLLLSALVVIAAVVATLLTRSRQTPMAAVEAPQEVIAVADTVRPDTVTPKKSKKAPKNKKTIKQRNHLHEPVD